MYDEYLNYVRVILENHENGNDEKYKKIEDELHILEERIKDDYLYVGVVGPFFSGKSTLINSILRKDLLPTASMQGGTSVVSILKEAEAKDLEIEYVDGGRVRFSDIGKELLEKYGVTVPEEQEETLKEENISIFGEITKWIKGLFGKTVQESASEEKSVDSASDTLMNQLFKVLVTTGKNSADIKCVTLFAPEAELLNKVALVDIPALGGNVKNTIDCICDAFIVTIPADRPLTEEVIRSINDTLEEQKEACIFIVTKIDLVQDRVESSGLIAGIEESLKKDLSMEELCVVPMPALMYLKDIDSQCQDVFAGNLSEECKNLLLRQYEDGLDKIKNIFSEKRNRFITGKILRSCERIYVMLSGNIQMLVKEREEKNKVLKEEDVEDLETYMGNACKEVNAYIQLDAKQNDKVMSFIQAEFAQLQDKINEEIEGCSTIRRIIYAMEFSSVQTTESIFARVSKYLNEVGEAYNEEAYRIEKSYRSIYEKCKPNGSMNMIDQYVQTDKVQEVVQTIEADFRGKIDEIKGILEKHAASFWGKAISIIYNPVNYYKKMVIQEMSEILRQMQSQAVACARVESTAYISAAQSRLRNGIMDMIKTDRTAIEEYREMIQGEMERNAKEIENEQECIMKLESHLNMLKKEYGKSI